MNVLGMGKWGLRGVGDVGLLKINGALPAGRRRGVQRYRGCRSKVMEGRLMSRVRGLALG